jgi:hypothetical protein
MDLLMDIFYCFRLANADRKYAEAAGAAEVLLRSCDQAS